ncbi:MAG: hypothetical protein ACPGXK_06210 [Phycisphaerae bacterium]
MEEAEPAQHQSTPNPTGTRQTASVSWKSAAGLLAIPLVAMLLATLVGFGKRQLATDEVAVIGRLGVRPGEFGYPRVITTDRSSIFIIDKTGRVQRFDDQGELQAHWTMPQVEAGKPVGATIHPDGRLFIADTHYNRVLITDQQGTTLGSFGRVPAKTSEKEPSELEAEDFGPGEFSLPTDVAVDKDGFIYVSEYYLTDRVSKWTPDLKFVQFIGDGEIEGKKMARPSAMVIDEDNTLWVADACNHRLIQFSLDGELLSLFGEFGTEPGQMRYPYDVNLSPDGSLIVCEYGGNRLQWFDKTGKSVRIWGESGRAPGQLFAPWGAAYGPGGKLFIVDSMNNRVQVVTP